MVLPDTGHNELGVCVWAQKYALFVCTCEAEGTQWVKWLLSGYSEIKAKLGLLLY